MCSQGMDQESLMGAQQSQEAQQELLPEDSQDPDFTLPAFSYEQKVLQIHDILQTLPVDHFTASGQTKEQTDALVTLMRDLEVHCGEGHHPEVNIASLVDRTCSASGATVLRKMLSSPIAYADNKKFANRQDLIKQLVDDPALFDAVDSLCASWAGNEDRMLSNWQKLDDVGNDTLNHCYFSNSMLKGCNDNPYVMELLTRAGNFGTSFQMAGDLLLYWAYFAFRKKIETQGQMPYTQALQETLYGAGDLAKYINPFVYYKAAKGFLRNVDQELALDPTVSPEKAELIYKTAKVGCVALPIAASVCVGLKAYTCKKAYDHAKQVKDAINFIQDRLIGMGSVIRSVSTLEDLSNEHQILANGLLSWQHADDLLHNESADNFTYLVDLLKKNTFEGDASFFSLSGRVLAAHKLMDEQKDRFAGAIELMGELDACLSVAKLYKQFEQRRVGYCFADLYQAHRPHMKLEGFWNPFVDYKSVVTNAIELGGQNKEQYVVLTGSNTGGKSTVGLKGSLISLYLAHTLGIAPADACTASQFTDFCSYLHVLDDVASGESSFQAEVNRANALIKTVKQLPKDQYAFIVIDELFKGTSPEKGAPGAYKVIKHLAQYDNVIFIIATHFKQLTELEQETQGRCVNMKIDIYEDEQGNLVRPHKLEYGISDRNIADTIMQSNLDDISFDL